MSEQELQMRIALMKCAGALQAIYDAGFVNGAHPICFTEKFEHLGTTTIVELLDEANQALEP